VLKKSKLLVRVNPIFEGSKDEIDSVIEYGADIVMLPFFKTKEEVNKFIGHVNGRAKAMLLVETPEAVRNIDSILGESGIDYIHIGLNDLHLGYRMKFMFEPLVDGTVEMLCKKIKQKSISLRIWRHCPAWNRSSAGGKHTCRTLQIGLFHGHPFKKLLQCKKSLPILTV